MKSCKESNQNNIKCVGFSLFSIYSSITLNHRHRITNWAQRKSRCWFIFFFSSFLLFYSNVESQGIIELLQLPLQSHRRYQLNLHVSTHTNTIIRTHMFIYINETSYTLTPSNRNVDLQMQLCWFVFEIFAHLLIKHTFSNGSKPKCFISQEKNQKGRMRNWDQVNLKHLRLRLNVNHRTYIYSFSHQCPNLSCHLKMCGW